MDNYVAQKHFESLCNALYTVTSELIRLEEFNDVGSVRKEIFEWRKIFYLDNKRIREEIEQMQKNNVKIIVTDKRVAYALASYYVGITPKKYDIINLDKKFEDIYPQDEISQKFLEGYKTKNTLLIKEAFDTIYPDIIYTKN